MKKIIIYGAGKKGKAILKFFKHIGIDDVVYAFCDKEYGGVIDNKKIISYTEAKNIGLPFVVSVTNAEAKNEIINQLNSDNIIYLNLIDIAEYTQIDRVEYSRNFCAFYHINDMDSYFNDAENEGALNVFWSNDSNFYKLFEQLDIRNVIELACGRGRHVEKYYNMAEKITLVDILDKNINYCKERFSDKNNISYYCNNGYNLEKLSSDTYTALFSYDAMVHFELMDIYEYLKDIYRVLKKGGKALIHHSNNANDYKASFATAVSGRSFMSKEIFAYLAYRCGFTIIEQKVIDWGEKNLDCISLIQKNGDFI